jgi:hypothetical protein
MNLPAQKTTLTILNALPLACAKSSVGSTQAGFIMALVGVPVDIGGEQESLVLVNGL